jgi:ABC-type multidrug transport system ATPase subunit
MIFLEVKNVSKGFGPKGRRTEVLEDITLEVEQGEFVAIIGYSGAGKTTLMSLLAGLLQPDSGSIRLNGKKMEVPIKKIESKEAPKLAESPQSLARGASRLSRRWIGCPWKK